MATKDVAVFDGQDWVSISGADGAPGADGKDVLLHNSPPSQANNVPNNTDEDGNPIPGDATLSLVLNVGASDDSTNVYDMTLGVPVGVPGPKGDDGTGVNILGEKPSTDDLPASGSPGDGWLIQGELWVWDAVNDSWIDAGSIQGPAGAAGKAPTFTSNVPVTYKACEDYTTTATVARDGGTDAVPNYKISMQVPKPVTVTKAADDGDGAPVGVTGACVGDFWIITG